MICVKIRLNQWVRQKCRNHEGGLRMSLLGCVQESKRSMACPPVAKSILPPTVGPDRHI